MLCMASYPPLHKASHKQVYRLNTVVGEQECGLSEDHH